MFLSKEASQNRLLWLKMHFFGRMFIASPFRPLNSDESDYFSAKVYDLGVKIGGKSNCSCNTQTSQTRPIIHADRY